MSFRPITSSISSRWLAAHRHDETDQVYYVAWQIAEFLDKGKQAPRCTGMPWTRPSG